MRKNRKSLLEKHGNGHRRRVQLGDSEDALSLVGLLTALVAAQPSKIKVIVDPDARGPCTTDIQDILMFAQSDRAEAPGSYVGLMTR